MRQLFLTAWVAIMFFYSNPGKAQYTFFTPENSYAIEVSLENSDELRLPIYRNSISSLLSWKDLIIGGTSTSNNESPFLFLASLSQRKVITVQDIEKYIHGQVSIRSGFVRFNDNKIFGGTIPGVEELHESGGHLFYFTITDRGVISFVDLGIPVKGEGIFSITGNKDGSKLFGITYPSGLFFSYDIKTQETKVFDKIAPGKEILSSLEKTYDLTPNEILPKLVTARNGMIYGSMPVLKKDWPAVSFKQSWESRIFSFDPVKENFQIIEGGLPTVWGRECLGQVECWAVSKNGLLYGGNMGDGQLFVLNPKKGEVKNLGKPIMMNHIQGITFASDGKLWGIAGGYPGYSHLFSYDDKEGFIDYGNPQFNMAIPGVVDGIDWRGFQLETITSSDNGKYIIMGENESLSQIMVFPVNK